MTFIQFGVLYNKFLNSQTQSQTSINDCVQICKLLPTSQYIIILTNWGRKKDKQTGSHWNWPPRHLLRRKKPRYAEVPLAEDPSLFFNIFLDNFSENSIAVSLKVSTKVPLGIFCDSSSRNYFGSFSKNSFCEFQQLLEESLLESIWKNVLNVLQLPSEVFREFFPEIIPP